ncbi:MAG: hypothetical protein A2X79_00760 [Desulfuromonadaceae bacterium GWB2_53_15]|nr:MAG: hypothetical protein A2X79_00760 [Desulfuromonadaceae bacterium GWB2_53_15]
MRIRIAKELELLKKYYIDVEHQEVGTDDWFLIPSYPLPEGWSVSCDKPAFVKVAFSVSAGHPGTEPYGFLVPLGISYNGVPPNNGGAPPKAPPFPGEWFHFSWSPGNWCPTADVAAGSNLQAWARSFISRLKEGV